MGKNYTLYINNSNLADFDKMADKGTLVNSLLKGYFTGTLSMSQTINPANGVEKTTFSSFSGSDKVAEVSSVRRLPTCPNGHLLADGKCLMKGCKYGKAKRTRPDAR